MAQIIQPPANYGWSDGAFKYQQGRAERMLAKYGPEKVKKLGFDKFLPSELEDIAIGAAVIGGSAYALDANQARQNLGKLVRGSVSVVGKNVMPYLEAFTEAYDKVNKEGTMSRRYAMLGLAALLSASCGGGPTSSTDDLPNNNPGNHPGFTSTLNGYVSTAINNDPVNGKIYFLQDTDMAPLGQGKIENGNYNNIAVNNSQLVSRIRFTGGNGVNTEINNDRSFGPGDNQNVDYRILDRFIEFSKTFNANKIWLRPHMQNPTFYDVVNREVPTATFPLSGVRAPYGLRRVEQDLTFYIKRAEAGGGQMSPEARINITKDIIEMVYTLITHRPFFGDQTIKVVNNPPEPGNGNLIVRYDAKGDDGKPFYYASSVQDGHRITGGEAATTPHNYRDGIIDLDEIGATLFFLNESDLMRPSMSNNISISELSGIDRHMIRASHFEALATRRKVLNGGTVIESYEPLFPA